MLTPAWVNGVFSALIAETWLSLLSVSFGASESSSLLE